jgi:hypothetical protein
MLHQTVILENALDSSQAQNDGDKESSIAGKYVY